MIFCVLCQNGAGHKPINEESKNCEHTIIPYAVAIKRMAEILIYKANECLSKVSKKICFYYISTIILVNVLVNNFKHLLKISVCKIIL